MTLLHHAAFDSKYELVEQLAKLPYYKDIVDDNSNDVTKINLN